MSNNDATDAERKALAEYEADAGELPPGNWPPSRGPEPKWMTAERHYEFPGPVLIENEEVLADLGVTVGAADDALDGPSCWHVDAGVDTLLKCGPWACQRLVRATRLVTVEECQQRYERAKARRLAQGRSGPTSPPEGFAPFVESKAAIGRRDDRARDLCALLNYPLRRAVGVRVLPFFVANATAMGAEAAPMREHDQGQDARLPTARMNVGWLLWSLAEAYRQIYERHEEFGVWGHSIRDLVFEALAIDGNRVFVGVGS